MAKRRFIILLIFCVFIFSSCKKDKEPIKCTHDQISWTIDLEATCTKEGSKHKECTICHEILQEVKIEKTAHSLIHHEELDASCTESGYKAYVICENCEYSTYEEIKCLGHNYVDVIVNPTCTDKGYTVHTCSRCNDSYTDFYVNELGHNYNKYISNDDGTHTKVCSNDSNHKVNEACNYGEWITVNQATLFSEGLEKHICKDCGYEETRIVASPHTHSYSNEWTIDIKPSCEIEGLKSHHCTKDNCSSVADETKIPALGHNYGEVTYEWNDTYSLCKATRVCLTDSNHIETESVLAIYYVITTPTCTNKGIGRYTSNIFNNRAFSIQTFDIEIKELGHDLIHHNGKEATCVESGYKAYDTCSRCYYHTYEEIKCLGHDYDEASYEWNDTYSLCKATRICLNDSNHVETESVSVSYEVITKPTCTTKGIGRYISNFFNNPVFTIQTFDIEIKELGHNYENEVCTKCYIASKSNYQFKLSDDGTYYIFTGMYNVNNILTIDIPNKYNDLPVAAIDDDAFNNCENIQKINIPDSIKYIDSNVFNGCDSLIYNEYENGYYLGNDTNPYFVLVKILDTNFQINNMANIISSYVFSNFTTVKSIIIPLNVTSIGSYAFCNCTSLESIVIPSSVTSIGSYAFCNCTSLKSITNSSSVTSIGSSAYASCTSLENITLPFIGGSKDSNTYLGYIFGASSYSGNSSYVPTSLKKVIILDSCISIGDYAFSECASLENIEIPSSVTSIGKYAFASCTSLESIIVNSNNISYQSIDGNLYTKDGKTLIQYAIGKKDTSFEIPLSVVNIGNSAFYNCTSIKEVIIEENSQLTSIGYDAFENCTSLESITIPSSVTSIGSSAFYNCTSLESITLPFIGGSKDSNTYLGYIFGASSYSGNSSYVPTSLKKVIILDSCISIGSHAFCNCTSLESIVIPSSVTSIGSYAFCNCTSLECIVIPSGVTSIENYAFYNCRSLECIVIPSGVTSIENYAFYNCRSLESITIPSSVTSIGESTFSGCESLNSITIPSSVTSIGNYAFQYCRSLESIELPSSVTSIGSSAFYNCTSLESITIPSSVTSIGDNAFYNCPSLENVYYNGTIEDWCKIKFSDADSNPMYYATHFYMLDNEGAYKEVTEIELPDTITSIGRYQFYRFNNVTKITIPSSVTSIEWCAFADCITLKEVIFEENSQLTTIGDYAFDYCSGLESITIPSSVTSISNKAFCNCTSLESIVIPSSVTTIGYSAFANCICLESITLPFIPSGYLGYIFGASSYIGYSGNSSYVPTGLKKVIILDSCTSIGYSAFNGCSSLENISIPLSVVNIGNSAFYNCTSIKEVIIEENSQLTSIGYDAFENCTSLESITIPSSVTSIGSSAFYNCTSLESITLPFIGGSKDSNTYLGYIFEASSYSGNSSYVPTSLKKVIILDSCISIGDYAFDDCTSLESIVIPSSVTSIGNYAFQYCRSLESIELPSSVTSIGNYVFQYCRSLESIEIPSSVTSIGSSAFYNCTSLESITIPSSVTSIGDNAFYNCPSLENVYYNGTIEDWCKIKFSDADSNPMYYATHFYMLDNEGAYKEVTEIELPDTITSIGRYQFYRFNNVTKITIPSSVTSIEWCAFSGCITLKEVIFEENSQLTTIGDYAFDYCSGLESITIPSSVTSIGRWAFFGCTSLESIVIPSSVTSIGKYTFYECKNLTIYCEASSSSSGWAFGWHFNSNTSVCPIVWNYNGQTINQ